MAPSLKHRPTSLPQGWMPPARMERIIFHWTGGSHDASSFERQHYHFLSEGDGNAVRGDLPVTENQRPISGNYVAHTRGTNTGSIGVALCGMAGATESPFDAGSYPLTKESWDGAVEIAAALCRRYGIPVTPKTLLSHAEVQDTLGIKQNHKWDIAVLPFDPSVVGARAIGDRFRRAVRDVIDGTRATSADRAVREPENGTFAPAQSKMELTGTVTASILNLRDAPNGADIGDLPRGTTVTILDHDSGWYRVRTPAGYEGYAFGRYISITRSPASIPSIRPVLSFEEKVAIFGPRLLTAIPQWAVDEGSACFGNLGHESEGLTDLTEDADPDKGYGWPMWTGPRREAFFAWCHENGLSPASDEANFGFLVHELQTTHIATVEAVAKAEGLEAKTIAFERHFERARIKHDDRRLAWARRAQAVLSEAKTSVTSDEETTMQTRERKSWLKSKGVIGSIGAILIPTLGNLVGLQVTEADASQAVEQVTNALTAVSAILALIGRVTAKSEIG